MLTVIASEERAKQSPEEWSIASRKNGTVREW